MTLQDVLALITILTVGVPSIIWVVVRLVRGGRAIKAVFSIAEQFQPNGGSSLKDRIEALHDMLDDVVTTNLISMNLVPYPLLRADGGGHVIWINRRFTHETGATEDESLGMGWLSIVCAADRDRVRSEWIMGVFDSRIIRLQFLLMDGREAVLEALPLVNKKHGVHGVVGTLRLESGFLHG